MRLVWGRKFRRTTLLSIFYCSVLGGIGLAHLGTAAPEVLCTAAILLSVVSLKNLNAAALIAALLLGLSCGWWRGSAHLHQLSVYDGLQYKEVTIMAQATDDALYGRSKELTFAAGDVVLDDGMRLPGEIQLSGFGANTIFQGDTVRATGKLYPGYGSYKGSISYAELQVVTHNPTPLSALRQKFTAGMQTALPEPLAPFAMGLLVGQRATLPDGVKQDLLKVGLTHIIAVSGYNLTIILQASRRLMGSRSKRMATLMSLGLIGAFLLLAGASASIVRAAIVSLLSMAAGYYGREFKPMNLILLAAAITAWVNPSYVWGDLSWYLSFLAFFGVMIVAPLIQARYPGGWHKSLIGTVALESVCAEVMSVPLILFVFGQMSLVGLPANVLVVALIPLAMLLGLVAGVTGMLLSPLAGWFAWPAVLLLNYMLDIAHLLAGLPHVFIQNRSLTLAGMLLLYAMIISLSTVLHTKTKRSKSAIITDKNQPTLEGATT